MDSLVMNVSSKSVILLYFTIDLATFHENPLFHFQALKNCFKGTLCSDLRNQLLFSFYENKHFLKKLVSYWAPAQSTRTKMTANGFSSYERFVKKCDFCCILQHIRAFFCKKQTFPCSALEQVFKEGLVF